MLPTVIEPLRAEWENARAAALTQARAGDVKKARAEVNTFHDRLCKVTVLDPACGSGNFLYVALQHLKILEGEVLDVAAQFGENFKFELEATTIDPHQFLGLELNPRAASIAELVLWIGYLQWHFRLHGKRTPPEPILRAFKNIQCRDAVLEYDGEPLSATLAMALENPDLPGLPSHAVVKIRDWQRKAQLSEELNESEQPRTKHRRVVVILPDNSKRLIEIPENEANELITVWDRRSQKTDMITGRDVPDESKRVPLLAYTNPRPAQWPQADFIIGNPPFIGTARMREDLGDGYAETLRATYPAVPESADFVLYWWHKAAELTRAGRVKRFGLITTNSLSQTFARRVVQTQMSATPPLSLLFAIPDHPWVDTAEGAAVRIAMTVGAAGEHPGELLEVTGEEPQPDGSEIVSFKSQFGNISADLTTGTNVTATVELKANEGLAYRGMQLIGSGFIVTPDEAKELGLGKIKGLEKIIRPYRNGKDLNDAPRGVLAIDLFGIAIDEVREKFPAVYQHVLTKVKPERDANNRASYRKAWWIHGEPRKDLRPALIGLNRYIATVETSKHRTFQFLEAEVLPDNKLVVLTMDDAFQLGVLSSRIHVIYSLAAGSWLGVGNDPVYAKSRCFDPFPFPLCSEPEKERIRKLADELDAHRKRVQAQHGLTLTGLYNVLKKVRAGEKLTDKEKLIHEKGLVSVLKQLHDNLDAAVFAAYGWNDLWKIRQEAHTGSIYDFKIGCACLLDCTAEQLFEAIADFELELDAEILRRLVTLNAQRAAEEKRGVIHWLRPEYQTKGQQGLTLPFTLPATLGKPQRKAKAVKPAGKAAWPKKMAERVQVVEAALHHNGTATPAELAAKFKRAKPADVAEILETLVTMGRARQKGGKFSR